jgi:hypothetical protein
MKIISSVLIILLSILSCKRQDLLKDCSCTGGAKIPITTFWTKAGIEPINITVLIYNEHDGSLALEHKYEHNANEIHSYIHVPKGRYSVVFFNELRNQIKNVKVRGHENLSTLEFYATENLNPIERYVDNKLVNQVGELGVKVLHAFEVTDELIYYTHGEITDVSSSTKWASEMLLNIIPDNALSWLDITVHVKGLNNSRMPALMHFHNISGGYIVSTNKNSMTPASIQFTIENRKYNEGSFTDGTISAKIPLFGTLGDRFSIVDYSKENPIIADILFMLVDKNKTLINQKTDVTRDITFEKERSGAITLNLHLIIDKPLPEVIPENDDTGFGSNLEDWNVIEIPIIVPGI